MRRLSLTLSLSALSLSAVAFCAPAGVTQEVAKLGLRPDFTFETELDNGFGIKSLAALRGTPTLVEFWGTY